MKCEIYLNDVMLNTYFDFGKSFIINLFIFSKETKISND